MWTYNTDTNQWNKQTDTLNKDIYDGLKKDLSSVKLYSKALSGANYLSISDINNIYEPLAYKNSKSWYIDPSSSIYNIGGIPSNGVSINRTSVTDYNKYTSEYGFSLKNSFTPEKAISELNFLQVDVATTTQIGINSTTISNIDGIKLLNGHIVLVKDQITTVDLDFSVDPSTYFKGNYYFISSDVVSNTYYYYNSDNGIYTFNNNSLIKMTFSSYENYSKLSTYIKLGNTNVGRQFHSSRLLNGYYPVESDPFEFLDKHNYLVRSQVDYHDLYENNYYDILKHGTQSYNIDGFTYTVPERLVYTGDFGVILVNKGNTNSQYIYSDYKYNLKSIVEVGQYYWACGEEGTILKISKIDFSIDRIDLGDEFNTLTSVSFLNNNRGIVVGKYNSIYYTMDGGYNWDKITINGTEAFSYNKVIYYSYNIIYIVGENGVFLELDYSDTGGWGLIQRNVIKNLTTTDEYELIEDINDMFYTNFSGTVSSHWNLNYSATGSGISSSKDCLFMVTNNNNLIVYEINNFVPEHDFLYLSFSQSVGDITSITRKSGSNTIVFSADSSIYSFDINNFNSVSTTSNVILYSGPSTLMETSGYSNKIFDYNGNILYNVGNLGLALQRVYLSPNTVIPTTNITPRMLVLDYDMANKLNFFDYNYDYRLPNSATFSAIGTMSGFNISGVNSTWIEYLRDSYRTYAVNADTVLDTPITFNTAFTITGTSSLTFSNTAISLTFSDIQNLYPIVGSLTQSRFAQFTPTTPSATYSIYMYKYMSIFNLPNGFCSVGDMLEISSDNIVATLMINYKFNTFYYAFNDFNQSILNSFLSSSVITIVNLNRYKTFNELVSNFDSHPLSDGYLMSYTASIIEIDPRFNNLTSYQSLEANISTNFGSGTVSYGMSYSVSYNQFGFVPNYSLLNYLSNINSNFTASKKFYTMPEYSNLPGNAAGSFTDDNIYYDSNSNSTYLKNKLVFGSNLKYEYDSLWLNTFVDITLNTSLGNYTKQQILITKKYYDTVIGGYAIEFNKKILDVTNVPVYYINIISRNTLGQISGDLQLFDNINKPLINKGYLDGTYQYFNYYDTPIKTKLNTDSYTKILLSDGDIKKYLTSIIYTDSDYKLSVSVLTVNYTNDIAINNSFNYGSNLGLNTTFMNDISFSQLAYLNFFGGTGSSQQLNPNYIGIHTISPIDDFNIATDVPYGNTTIVGDIGTLRISSFDPFFNYKPINLLDIGTDLMYKIPILLSENNLTKTGLTSSLIAIDESQPVFRLIDGLDINLLSQQYHWILEAEITEGIIGLDSNGIVWYNGNWHSGRWFGGTWNSGNWITGDWYGGTWSSLQIKDNVNTVSVGKTSVSNLSSVWYDGRWFDGTWNSGTWLNGRRYAGSWNTGNWYNGIWNDGIWNDGLFAGGIWVQGTWNYGTFNCSNKPSYWIDGKFRSGDFQNGIWYNGQFGENQNVLSKFGTLSTNSRNAIWYGGIWSSGNFYSNENIDSNGNISVSIVHKYSTWKTGIWNTGNFYGGVVYSIEFNNGIWHGGITNGLEIIGVNPTQNSITLNGVFRFNIGDYINILNNGNSTPYYNLGNYDNPGRYRVANTILDLDNEVTTLILDYNFSSLSFTAPYNSVPSSNVNTQISSVSKFKDITWKTGIWNNGIFEGGTFESGIWYDGLFLSGNWGTI